MGVIQLGNPIIGRWPALGGAGFVAGVAPGLVTVNGAPGMREVEVRHRVTRMVADVTRSGPDGTYRIVGVDPSQEFDVIGRDYVGTYNDAIIARVRPMPYDVQSITGVFTANNAAKTLDGELLIYGGLPGHTVAVTSGTAPPGLTFSVAARRLAASGTTVAGSYSWTLTATAPGSTTSASIACSATFT